MRRKSEPTGQSSRRSNRSEDEEPILFDGRTEGKIVRPRGSLAFGWDPIFEPDEANGLTYAEMTKEGKDSISHRSRAMAKLRAIYPRSCQARHLLVHYSYLQPLLPRAAAASAARSGFRRIGCTTGPTMLLPPPSLPFPLANLSAMVFRLGSASRAMTIVDASSSPLSVTTRSKACLVHIANGSWIRPACRA